MHIEINAGGLGAGIAVAEYQLNMSGFISDAESVISSFKAVSSKVHDLNGGVGSLQGAVDDISSRIQLEEEKREAAITVQKKSNDFLDLAIRVDKQVASLVNKNKDEFYKTNPWMKPAVTVDDTPWYEDAWNWLCGKGEQIAEGLKNAWEWTKDTAKKAWDGLVEFYNEHKKIIDTVLIVVGAIGAIIAVVATGGVALVPLLGALGVSTTAAIAISTAVAVVAVVSTVASSALNIVDTWAEIDNPTFNAWQKGLNIVSAVSNLTYSIGTIYNSIKHVDPTDYIASHPATNKSTYTNTNQLSQKQTQAIVDYSGNDCYNNINDSLRGLDTPTSENAKIIESMRDTLGNSSLPDDMTLYRGTGRAELGDLKNLTPDELVGKSFYQDGFMSTSPDPNVAKGFTRDVFVKIEAPSGSHGLDITNISRCPWEKEILFDVGQELLIIDAEEIKGVLHITTMLK